MNYVELIIFEDPKGITCTLRGHHSIYRYKKNHCLCLNLKNKTKKETSIMMSSMVLSSPLSGLSHSKLIIFSNKYSSSPSKAHCIYFSNKISLESSSKSSFIHGDFTVPSPNLSTFVSKSSSSNTITAQTSPLGEHVIYDFQAKV